MERSGERDRLVDFPALGDRLRGLAAVLGVLALGGVVVEGLLSGLTFGAMLRWAGVYLVAILASGAVLVTYSAYRGADRAGKRGEPLSGKDVGLVPPRRPRNDTGG